MKHVVTYRDKSGVVRQEPYANRDLAVASYRTLKEAGFMPILYGPDGKSITVVLVVDPVGDDLPKAVRVA